MRAFSTFNLTSVFLMSLFFITSCSTNSVKMIEKKTYSSEVEQEFENIENDQKRVLNYYRTLREKNWEEYKEKGKQISRRRYTPPVRKAPVNMIKKETRTTAPEPTKPELNPSQIEELNIEIHQNLSYYCMKNRKSGKFSDQSECQSFTQNIFNECKEKFPVYRDRSPVNCIKEKLQ